MTRYLPAKLFFVVAILSFLLGAAINRHGVPGFLLWHPLFWLFALRSIPFAVCGLAAAFGAIYLESERRFLQPPNLPFAIGHLVTFLVAVWGHVATIRQLEMFLGDNPPDASSYSLHPFEVTGIAVIISLVLFFISLVSGTRAPESPA